MVNDEKKGGSFMAIVMKKKRKEPINKVAIRLVCNCIHRPEYCDCGCTETRQKYGTSGVEDAAICGYINLTDKTPSTH